MKAILLGLGLALLGVTAAQAIDCTKAKTDVEQSICDHPDAKAADDVMSAAYAAALKLSPARYAADLKADQADWLSNRGGDCVAVVDKDGNVSNATPDQIAQCVITETSARIIFLSAKPAEGPGVAEAMIPVSFSGFDAIYEESLRFVKPVTPGEKAYNAALDAELKKVHVSKAEGDNSDAFNETLVYLSSTLLSAKVVAWYNSSASPMPYDFGITIDMADAKRLKTADAFDAKAAAQLDTICADQLKTFVAAGTGGDDHRRDIVKTMTGNLDFFTFGATKATLTYVDEDTQDDPVVCTIGYDVLKPLMKASFPLPS